MLRLERDAWPMVKRLGQAANEYAPPPPPPPRPLSSTDDRWQLTPPRVPFLSLQVGQKYHVLCVMTDGIINDMVRHCSVFRHSVRKQSIGVVWYCYRSRVNTKTFLTLTRMIRYCRTVFNPFQDCAKEPTLLSNVLSRKTSVRFPKS